MNRYTVAIFLDELKAIDKEIDAEVADCVEFALAAPEPKAEELTRYIWAED
ncbi:MAG: pyruvate dehydrogenase (acetyl-transferring) component subunit alpha [Cyanobacteriota bacterium]